MTTLTGCENWPRSVPFPPNGAVTHNSLKSFDIEHTHYSECCNLRGRTGKPDEPSLMNKDESDRIHDLCSLIAVEQDRKKFLTLVEELNRILSAQHQRLEKTQKRDEGKD